MKKLIFKSIGAYINLLAIIAPKKSAAFAFALLCKVNKAGVSDKGAQFFEEGSQYFFEVEGHSSVLHQWGNGPKKLLFLHGWESNSQRWLPYYELLDKSQYTIYALDAPGHGMSKGNTFTIEIFRQAIVYSLNKIGKVDTLISHSLSNTAISYLYLTNSTIKVDKFVVMGAASGMDAVFVYFKNMLGISKKGISALSNKINSILIIPHEKIKLSNFLLKVKQPVLVIHDKEDKITPYSPIKKVLAKNKSIKTYITNGLKHDLKSEEVYNVVIKFIEQPIEPVNLQPKIKEECI